MDDIRILALGSPHGDDQVAWVAGRLLQELPEAVHPVFFLNSPWDIPEHLAQAQLVIVLDACQSESPLGTVQRWTRDNLEELPTSRTSTHAGSLCEAIQLAQVLGHTAEVVVLGVEIAACQPMTEMSEAAQRGADALVSAVDAELEDRVENP